jgi:hypothetical protein
VVAAGCRHAGQRPRISGELVAGTRHLALSGPALVPGQRQTPGKRPSSLSTLRPLVVTAQLAAGNRRPTDPGGRRHARAAGAFPVDRDPGQRRPLWRSGVGHPGVDELNQVPRRLPV